LDVPVYLWIDLRVFPSARLSSLSLGSRGTITNTVTIDVSRGINASRDHTKQMCKDLGA